MLVGAPRTTLKDTFIATLPVAARWYLFEIFSQVCGPVTRFSTVLRFLSVFCSILQSTSFHHIEIS